MVSPRRELALSDDELRIVRDMIAERQYDQARSRFLSSAGRRGRLALAALGAVVVFIVQCATLYYTTHDHPQQTIIVKQVHP